MSGFKIELFLRQAQVDAFGAALDGFADAIAAFEVTPGGEWRMEAYSVDAPDPDAVTAALAAAAADLGVATPAFHIGPLPSVDWLAENRLAFPPQRLGRFFIHGSHFEGKPPAGRVPLLIDAATAFGSGEHATTRLCLKAIELEAKKRRLRRPLDVGCGSGVLSIAAAKLARIPVLACDIDPESVRVARENAVINQAARWVRPVRADGFGHPALKRGGHDLILANILARPLRKIARDVARSLAPGGICVLSGLLTSQEAMVGSAYRGQGLALVARNRKDGWSSLTFRRGR